MKLSIYLLRPEIGFDETIQPKHLSGEERFVELTPILALPYESRAWVQRNKPRVPKWLGFLRTHFAQGDLDLTNTSNSFVLLMAVSGRLFAVTFGYGFNALERSAIEPRFGLKVALNSLDPEQIKTLDTRNIDLVTKQKRTNVSVGSPITEFGLDFNVDWVRYVQGKPLSKLGTSVSGADPLAIACDSNLDTVHEKCAELLELYESDVYKKRFPFIDHLQPLGKSDARLKRLKGKLSDAFFQRKTERLGLAAPQVPDERLDAYSITYKGEQFEVDELALEKIYAELDRKGLGGAAPDLIFVVPTDDSGSAVGARQPMYDYLVAEIELEGGTYVLSLGQWFLVEKDFVASVRAELQTIEDLSSALSLPSLDHGEWEGAYNKRIASDRGWVLLDKQNFYFPGTYDKVEVCDLLTEAKDFIAVKKMTSSATLSHLFAQASVSATLLRDHVEYRNRVEALGSEKWPAFALDTPPIPRFVYVVASDRSGAIHESMFIFSVINLLQHAKAIRHAGFRVAVCKVGINQ